MSDLLDRVGPVADIVRAAGTLSLQWFRASVDVENKGSEHAFDPVTVADRAVEDALRRDLAELGPAEIYGEERGVSSDGNDGNGERFRWVIDPIDGTRAFISGQPMWGVLVGLLDRGEPVAGWMYLPVLDEMYEATPAGGTVSSPLLGVRSLGSSSCRTIPDATLLITHPSMFAGADREPYERLEAAVRLSRFSGDCMNFGLLATGAADLAVENGLMPYDIIPLLPILEAAGVTVADLQGRAPLEGGFVIAAATAELFSAARAYFTGSAS